MFNRRAPQAARELEYGRLRPRERETAARGHRVRMGQARDERHHDQRPDDGSEPITAWLGPVAPLVGLDGRLHRGSDLGDVRLGLGDEPTHRRAADIAAGSTERMRAETLRPSVQRRVRGRVAFAQTPRHVPQTPAARRVRRDEVLDRRQAERLPRQHVAR
jgi:hypothetical protein